MDFDPNAFLAQAESQGQQPNMPSTEGFDPNAFLEEQKQEKYGTPGQMAKTAAEGVAQGVLGPLAPSIETTFGVNPEDIRARQETNPITHGVGEAAGLVGGALTGTGEAALLEKAGVGAAELAGLSKVAAALPEASYGFKVGSSAVTQAAEMAVLQGSDEVSKMVLQDPNTSAETAIANIGLAAALGGAGGAFMTGAVNPLWEATVGPKVETLLGSVKNHFNGTTMLPDELAAAKNDLGIHIAPELEAVMSGNPTAVNHFNILKEGQNKAITEGMEKLHSDMSNSVAQGLGIGAEDVANYSENEAGHEIQGQFKKEFSQRYKPAAEAMEHRDAISAPIKTTDADRLDRYGKLLEQGMEKVGTDSPYYKLYNDYGNRLLAKETIGAMDMLKTEISGEIDKAVRGGDTNALMALRDIRSSIADFQESQIEKQAFQIGKEGLKDSSEILAERQAANAQYKQFAKMSNELTDHLGIGRFTGAGGLIKKLESLSGEQLLNKFSFKGNTEFIPFLKQNFPGVYEKVRENELKKLIKPSVLSAKGEQPINISKLNSIIEKGMAGQKEYIESVLPQQAISRIQAANKISEAFPNVKSSGTAGWAAKMFADVPRNAMAGIGMLTGHNPLLGGLIGETAQRLSRDVPDAIRLAHLKYLASDRAIKASGFGAMVDFFHNTYKGETMLAKATSNVFKRGAQILTDSAMPNDADRTKLDKMVTKMQNNPQDLMNAHKGEVGYYLPNHQESLSKSSTQAMQYLQSIKPQPHILGPLDKPVPPQPVEIARYNRALDIATSPAIVLQRVKDGTLQQSDIADLHNMYPALYKSMSQKLSNQMMNQHADEEPIPYKTRMGISLFLGQPLDVSMRPESIMAAQPMPTAPTQAPQGQKGGKSMKAIGKNVKSYMTPSQTAESDRSNRE